MSEIVYHVFNEAIEQSHNIIILKNNENPTHSS